MHKSIAIGPGCVAKANSVVRTLASLLGGTQRLNFSFQDRNDLKDFSFYLRPSA